MIIEKCAPVEDDMMNRRKILKSLSAVSLAALGGCTANDSHNPPVEIGVINNRAETYQVNLELRDTAGELLIETELEVEPSGSAHRDEPFHPTIRIEDLVTTGEEYEFSVEANGESHTARVNADCSAEEVNQWTARLRDDGSIIVHDSSC